MRLSVLVRSRMRAFSALLVAALAVTRLCALPAFPGAEGFGANATGGRGGTVYVVTNLNDSGAGSFRDAVSQPNRTVVFAVGGIIRISSRVAVRNNITIAGQTAPGDGITIYGNGVSFSNANNTICRYIRFRQGINGDGGTDAVGIASGDAMIFDHVSASWGRDETFSVSGTPSNITLQDCIVGQGLLIHSAGGLMQTDGGVSVFRTLYTDNWMRNPKVKGVHEFTNNVVYNWGGGGGYILGGGSAGQSYANVSNNYFIAGPNSPAAAFTGGNLNFHIFADNNFHDANRNGALDGAIVPPSGYTTVDFVPARYPYPAVASLLSPTEAYAHIVAHAGASLRRDQVDAFMVSELTSLGTIGAQIVNESEVGGPGVIAGGVAAVDTDGDGMPDWWEQAAGTNLAVADNNSDLNGDGYTNLENYLNALAPTGVPGATITEILTDSGASATDGITTDATLVIRGTSAPGRVITLARADTGIIGTAVTDGSGQWAFDYSATALPDRYYAFTATADLGGGQASPPTHALVVKVDTTAPVAPNISGLATSPSYLFNGTAAPGDAVTLTQDGVGPVATATTDALGRWSAAYTGTPPAPGVYSFTATAVDLAGNAGAASAPYIVNTALTPPTFSSIQSDTGVSSSDKITNDGTLNLLGTAPASSVVSVTRVGTGVIGTATANASGTWTFNYTGTTLPSGDYIFTATAATGGTSSPVSSPFTVKVDTVAPTIDTIARNNPTTPSTASSTLVFRVTFFEPVINVDTGDFILTPTGTGMTGTIASLAAVSPSVYDVTVTGAGGDGTIRLDRRSGSSIQDLAGNAGSSGTFTGGQSYTMRLPGSGVWDSTESGAWSDVLNWEDGLIATGPGATADFSTRDIDGDVAVQLDTPRTIGRLVFGDADQASLGKWILGDNGNTANALSLASTGSPTLQVNFTGAAGQSNPDVAIAGAAWPVVIDAAVNSSAGLTKSGWGTAVLNKIGTLTGPINVTQGRLKLGAGAVLTSPSVALAVSTQFEVAGGTFTATGDATMVSGTGVGYIVSAGTASFQRIVPTNARNNLVKVTGGSLTATELNFPRSGDAAGMYAFGLVVQGGEATITTVGLGTVNSWGAMSIEGGRLVVNELTLGFQQTAARGGQARMLGGELVVNELVMSRKNATNAYNIAELHLLGGITTAERLTLGYDASVNAGSATVNLNGGALYLGAGGIVRNGVAPFVTNLNLLSGVLGAKASWSTAVPFALTGSVTIQAADAGGIAHDITLGGDLVGAGELIKTGGGTLTLAGGNSFTGSLVINGGSVRVSGALPAGGSMTINADGTIVGDGSVAKPIVLNGTLAPGGASPTAALTADSLTWNGGGQLAISLAENGASNRLVLSGALSKGVAGTYTVRLTAGGGFAAGNTYTLASFSSTDFSATDFTVSGLPAGFGAVLTLNGTSLQARIVATPVITSALTAIGTYGAPFSYTITAANEAVSYSATGLPAGLTLAPNGIIAGMPAQSGSFTVILGATNAAGTGQASLALTIAKDAATLTLAGLEQAYDGTPRPVTANTTPGGLAVTLTYDGESTAPTLPGTYEVEGTIDDPNHEGSVTGTLTITVTALVRHAPTLNGGLDGSVQVLQPENVTLNGGAFVAGDLLLPGTPTVRLNGNAVLVGTIDSDGSATPASHTVTLNGNSAARKVVRRVDPIDLPVVAAPPQPSGTRNVSLNNASQSAGDFATLRNLTLNSNVGAIAVPPGTYGNFSANSRSGFVLGVAGATQPSVYHFQNLTLNSNATFEIVGPVIVVLNGGFSTNTDMGSVENPGWLELRIAGGGLTLASQVTVHALVTAPAGTITLNGNATLRGRVAADRLTINGNALLEEAPAGN